MELNAEINKIFGIEMAKLFADKISEEELTKKAKDVWEELNRREPTSYWNDARKDTVLETRIKNVILDRLYEKIRDILNEPINEELLEQKARDMVKKAREAAEQVIIKDMAAQMADNVLSVYHSREHIVDTVLQELRMRSANK